LAKGEARQIIDQLLDRQLITRTLELEKVKIKPKTVPYVKLVADRESELQRRRARLQKSRAHKQAEVLEFLAEQTQPVSVNELKGTSQLHAGHYQSPGEPPFGGCGKGQDETRPFISPQRDKLLPLRCLTPSQEAAWQSIDP
jgi:hypothetical protein